MQIVTPTATLEAEVHGPADGKPLLLVMGLGMQLVAWREGLVEQLVARGFRVIRFDNRDAGLSQRFHHLGTPHVGWQALRHMVRLPVQAPYSLADMATDAAGLLDALGIDAAHVCGASMGGMIAQHLAMSHPRRVRSLTLIMTSSGARHLPQPSLKVRAALLRQPGDASREAVVDHYVRLFRLIGSPAYPPDEVVLRQFCHHVVQRGGAGSAAGLARQITAVAADPDRTPRLRRLQLPVHVLHGAADPLLPPACGEQLAQVIPGATLDLVPGMGHDLPPALWPRFADGIASVAQRSA